MRPWRQFLEALGATLVVVAVVLAAVDAGAGGSPWAAVVDVLLVAGPGVAVAYGAWSLPQVDIDPDLYPRVAGWTLGVMVFMVSVVMVATLRPGRVFAQPVGAALSASALGAAGGLVIGLFEGRALTRTRDQVRTRRVAEEVRRRNQELEEIQSVIAHDVKGPLSGVYGNIEMAQNTGDLAHLDDAIQATERVEELVEDLGHLAREGLTVTETSPVPLEPLVRDVWGSLERPRKARLTVEAEDLELEADRRRLQRLLENLLRNALVHGGPDVHVRVGALAAGGFYVADDGPGFPADAEGKVLDVGYTTHEEGTGFGLSIVERIARAHGWEVSLGESAAGGARVEVHA